MSSKDRVPRIVLDSSYFHDIRNTIGSKPVAWEALIRVADLNEEDANIAKELDAVLIKHSTFVTGNELSIEDSVASLLNLLVTCSNQDAKRAVINLIVELLTNSKFCEETVRYFQKRPEAVGMVYESTLGSYNLDEQAVLVSVFMVVSLLIQDGLHQEALVEKLMRSELFLGILRNESRLDTCYIGLRLLQELTSVKQYRHVIWKQNFEFMPTLFQLIDNALDAKSPTRVATPNSNNVGIQSQYYSLLIIWLLTFEPAIASDLTRSYLTEFLKLLKLVKITIKEKITRSSIAIILNCVDPQVKGHKTVIKNILLLGSGLSIFQQLGERKYSDDELREDLAKLRGILESEYQELTSFDEYVAELDSKLLMWSPPHIDNSFWSENCHRFKEDNWKLFKQLLEVLKDYDMSQDSKHNVAVQVALNDITHIVELEPECVDVLGKLNAKVIIMELLNHPDSKVKYEALKATQAFVANTFK
ncbi:HHR218Wp [Eremothecium sinecaudum]|uniref:V-type proton ATPase subunit H n=1 Tax=Eremothecium sinecaudum TaxID=45286 RepID=A0A0X8HWU0_9SACH|nr:HHR218Wp [Eremothecium sinecaudum]AMD22987.1 HHR218Wp [Eremothecium sinecaudum]